MKKIPTDAKILSISHNDMDGVGAQILLGAVFKNITFACVGYYEIDKVLLGLNGGKDYDYVFLTDITPTVHEIVDGFDNMIVIDHHQNMPNNPKKNIFINHKHSATYLTKYFLEKLYKIKLSKYDDLVKYIDDYDMWRLKYKGSKRLNSIYSHLSEEKFRKRFMSGELKPTKSEKEYVLRVEKEFDEMYDNLEITEYEKINGCVFSGDTQVNELAHRLMNEDGYDFVIFNTTKNFKLSIRSVIQDFNFGVYLKERGIGGGHKLAAGINTGTEEEMISMLNNLEDELYEAIPSIRK